MSGIIDRLDTENLTEYERGWVEGVYQYAWWKDGVIHVGTTGSTLDDALRRFFHERGRQEVIRNG